MSETHSYRETIRAPLWLQLLLLGLAGGAVASLAICREASRSADPALVWGIGLLAALTLLVTLALAMLFGRLSLCAEHDRLVVRFGYLPLLHKEIAFEDIIGAKAVRYKPIRHFGGWGVRRGRYQGIRTAIYSLRGSKGVLLTLREPVDTHLLTTDHIIVGSQRPLELAEYLLPHIADPQGG